jgi:hypothetical protein
MDLQLRSNSPPIPELKVPAFYGQNGPIPPIRFQFAANWFIMSQADRSVGEAGMTTDMQKEQFSRAYVQAVAACAGFAWSVPSVDDDSIDMSLHQTGGGGTIRSPRIDLQLKCKASPAPAEDAFSYSLKLKNYDDLRDETVLVPRILVVVLVPDQVADWLEQSETELALRRCGYWLSLRGMPASENETGQTVQVSRDQLFNVVSLQSIMQRIGNGALP